MNKPIIEWVNEWITWLSNGIVNSWRAMEKSCSSFLYSQETSYSEKTDLASNPISASCRLCNLGQVACLSELRLPCLQKEDYCEGSGEAVGHGAEHTVGLPVSFFFLSSAPCPCSLGSDEVGPRVISQLIRINFAWRVPGSWVLSDNLDSQNLFRICFLSCPLMTQGSLRQVVVTDFLMG